MTLARCNYMILKNLFAGSTYDSEDRHTYHLTIRSPLASILCVLTIFSFRIQIRHGICLWHGFRLGLGSGAANAILTIWDSRSAIPFWLSMLSRSAIPLLMKVAFRPVANTTTDEGGFPAHGLLCVSRIVQGLGHLFALDQYKWGLMALVQKMFD